MMNILLRSVTPLLAVTAAYAEPIASSDIYVLDGNTIDMRGQRVRLVGLMRRTKASARAVSPNARWLRVLPPGCARSSAAVAKSNCKWLPAPALPAPKGLSSAIMGGPADA